MPQERLYIITRSDLPIGDQAVQACHAVELWKVWSQDKENSHTIALLVVKDEINLMRLVEKLNSRFLKVYLFREPDLQDQVTAIACLTDKQNLFNGLKKLGE